MSKRDTFLLRIDPAIMGALRKWAEDDLRSLNGQLEFLLRDALKDAGRLPSLPKKPQAPNPGTDTGEGTNVSR